jgi:hypothetical protein
MPIPEDVLKQIKCCLNEDGHIVHEPVLLKCGYNACKKCCSDLVVSTVKCFSCHNSHDKNELLNAPYNKAIDLIIKKNLNDLFQDLNLKQESIKGLKLLLFHLNLNEYKV